MTEREKRDQFWAWRDNFPVTNEEVFELMAGTTCPSPDGSTHKLALQQFLRNRARNLARQA